MSILPDCRVFDYSANFSTHDSTVPRISDVCCQRLTLYLWSAPESRSRSPSMPVRRLRVGPLSQLVKPLHDATPNMAVNRGEGAYNYQTQNSSQNE